MFDFYSIFEIAQIRAMHEAIDPGMESIWRMKCREYSQRFYTPLHEVSKLDPAFILQALYEEHYTPSVIAEEMEDILEKLYQIQDPNYVKLDQAVIEEMVDNVINKEIKRLSKKKRPTEEKVDKPLEKPIDKIVNRPRSGSMDFSQLERIDAKSESNKPGFRD
jgi:hypothetical protein